MIDATEYEFVRQLVYDRSRINLGPDKVELVCSRLRKRVRALQLNSLQDYFDLLRSASGQDEIDHLLDVISTNVTEFFREYDHFDFLRNTVLPERTNARTASGTFRVWSAACSSGEEPYSVALLLADYYQDQSAADWRIVGSDISTRMLDRARDGIYLQERIKLPKPEWLQRYFQKGTGQREGYCRLKGELRSRVTFQRLNLFQWPYPFTDKFDVIFCRNVMIYFDRRTQEQLVPRLKDQLQPNGYLFVGHSESLIGIDHALKCVRPSIYQRGPVP